MKASTPLLPRRIKRTARVLILRFKSKDLEFYGLWQHKKHKNVERLVLPGGQIEVSFGKNGEIKQEKIINTAIRETLEEVSVSELNIKHFLGVHTNQTKQKTGHKHTYIFLAKVKGKVKDKETDKFNSHKSCFYPLKSIKEQPHAEHLHWIYKQYKKGNLDKPVSKFLR